MHSSQFSEKFWQATGQSNLADKMEDCSTGRSSAVSFCCTTCRLHREVLNVHLDTAHDCGTGLFLNKCCPKIYVYNGSLSRDWTLRPRWFVGNQDSKKPMILCARSTSRSSERSTKLGSHWKSMQKVCLFYSKKNNEIISLTNMADRNSPGMQRFVGFFLDCLLRMLIGWADKLQSHWLNHCH